MEKIKQNKTIVHLPSATPRGRWRLQGQMLFWERKRHNILTTSLSLHSLQVYLGEIEIEAKEGK